MINLINNIDNNICCKTVCIRWPKLRLFNFGVNLKINRTCDCREMRECTCVVIALHMIVVWMHGVYVPGMHACMHGMHECTCDYWGLGEDWFVTVVVSAISMCTCGASCPGLANQHGVVGSRRPSSAAVRPAASARRQGPQCRCIHGAHHPLAHVYHVKESDKNSMCKVVCPRYR